MTTTALRPINVEFALRLVCGIDTAQLRKNNRKDATTVRQRIIAVHCLTATGMKGVDIMERVGVSQRTVWNIINNHHDHARTITAVLRAAEQHAERHTP